MYNKQKVTVIDHYSARPQVEYNKITIFQTAFKLLYDKKVQIALIFAVTDHFEV